MSDHNQINRVVQNIVNTNNLHIQKAALMDIENQKNSFKMSIITMIKAFYQL